MLEQNRARELILCENDPLQREELAGMIHDLVPDLVIHPVSGAAGLQTLLKTRKTGENSRIFLMDIVLDNGEDGIDLARYIHRLEPGSPVVFMSAFLEKACEVYEVDHCFFIYKPEKEKWLRAALAKAIRLLDKCASPLVIHDGTAIHRLNPSSILCIERVRRCTFVTCRNRVLKAREDLQELLEKLPDSFVQCHRSYVVNFAMTSAFYGTEFEMTNGLRIPVSRARQQEIREAYTAFLLKEETMC